MWAGSEMTSISILGIGLLLPVLTAIASPIVVHFFRFRYSREILAAAKWCFLPLVFVAAAAFFWFLKISFAFEVLNALTLFIAVACFVQLIFFAFKLAPKKLFATAALVSTLTILVTVPILEMLSLQHAKLSMWVKTRFANRLTMDSQAQIQVPDLKFIKDY
jgi:hypothetical protein